MKIDIVNKSTNEMPEYATVGSAGMDLKADLIKDVSLDPLERLLIPTGIYIQLPIGYEAQIRPRSGLALKNGISVLNTPGTIDSDFRGQICIILINLSNERFTVHHGDRIAQMVISSYERVDWNKVDELKPTERGEGGFGHTGKK